MKDKFEDCSANYWTTETENMKEETATEDEMEIEISLSKKYKVRSQRNGKQTGENNIKKCRDSDWCLWTCTKSPSMQKWKINWAKIHGGNVTANVRKY